MWPGRTRRGRTALRRLPRHQVVKIFDVAVAGTGLSEGLAREAGFSPVTHQHQTWDHKTYYPDAHELHIRIRGDAVSGRLLGAQILGHYRAEVAKRIDIFSAALFAGLQVEDLSDLDLSYTPPLGAPWDAIQESAQAWLAHIQSGDTEPAPLPRPQRPG